MTNIDFILPDNIIQAQKNCNSAAWRIQNLYYIINKQGKKELFNPNWAQRRLWNDKWYCNIVLKARQLGISTFVCLMFLDRCLFNSNVMAGIIAHTLEDSQQLFRRIKFAYENLPEQIRTEIPANNDTTQMLVFKNGSTIRVGTSMRSSTCQYLHISEFGKICNKYPEKAREIVTGSLNTIAAGQYVFIESTAEGRESYFYDMCKKAQADKESGKELSILDFKFHFYPWWEEPAYRIGSPVVFGEYMHNYFISLETRGIKLDDEQKWWYAAKEAIQGNDIKREYPSTPEESFEASHEGLYYGKQMSLARAEGRVSRVVYDENMPVHTSWDLGFNDSTAIWFYQILNKEIHIIDYLEGSCESMTHWIMEVMRKPYIYGKHLAPHDISSHEYSTGLSRIVSARKLGINFIPVPRAEIISGIDAVRLMLPRCWFDETKCVDGIRALDNYKKTWNDKLGCWASQPLHDKSSHGSDAFRNLACGLSYITNAPTLQQQKLQELELLRDDAGLLPGSFLYSKKQVNY